MNLLAFLAAVSAEIERGAWYCVDVICLDAQSAHALPRGEFRSTAPKSHPAKSPSASDPTCVSVIQGDGGLFELGPLSEPTWEALRETTRAHYPMGFPPAPKPVPSTAPVAPNEAVPPTLPSGRVCYYHGKPAILIREGVALCAMCVEKAVPR